MTRTQRAVDPGPQWVCESRGRSMTKAAPAPGPLSTCRRPPCDRMIASTMLRPSPAPPLRRDREGVGPVEPFEDLSSFVSEHSWFEHDHSGQRGLDRFHRRPLRDRRSWATRFKKATKNNGMMMPIA